MFLDGSFDDPAADTTVPARGETIKDWISAAVVFATAAVLAFLVFSADWRGGADRDPLTLPESKRQLVILPVPKT